MQHRLVEAPVDAQAVLFLLHSTFALAAVQRCGQKRLHGIVTLVARPGPQFHAAVSRHTLPEGAQSWAAGVVTGAGVSSLQAVAPACRQNQAWDSCEERQEPG